MEEDIDLTLTVENDGSWEQVQVGHAANITR